MRTPRQQLADAIRRVADGSITDADWQTFFVTHYADIESEAARRTVVRLRVDDSEPSPTHAWLDALAADLSRPADPRVFFFRDMAVGVLDADPPNSGAFSVAYEPFRGPGHFEFATAMKAGHAVECEFMRSGERRRFHIDSKAARTIRGHIVDLT